MTAYVLQYRVPNKKEGALQDAQRAIRMIKKANNTHKIGIMGFSAGGSLSARAATSFNKMSYPSNDEIDELSARPDFAALIYPAYLDLGVNFSLTPELTISKETPPMFIFGTSDDQYGNSALVMTSALRKNKIPVELHFLAEGGHGYGLRKGNIAAETWPYLLKEWLLAQF
ncbi:MAG: dienelactone hydrolase family protein [Prolixibacteraceae bacterium]|nr:dienelactone hydrolase family protein [Prolixibacteraceae bacterium]